MTATVEVTPSLKKADEEYLYEILEFEDEYGDLYEAASKELQRRKMKARKAESKKPGARPYRVRRSYSDSVTTLRKGDCLTMQGLPGMPSQMYVEVVGVSRFDNHVSVRTRKTNTDDPPVEYTYPLTATVTIQCGHKKAH